MKKSRILLAAHKVALLAIENAGKKIVTESVLGAGTTLAKFRTSRSQIKAVQLVSEKLAFQHAQKEFALKGVQITEQPKLDNTYVQKLNDDLRQSLKDPNLTDQEKARRAGLAASGAANRAYTDMQLAVFAQVGTANPDRSIQKIWATNQEAGSAPCPACTALNGLVVGVGDEFPLPEGVRIYHNLAGPPLHPNCRCRIISRLGESYG